MIYLFYGGGASITDIHGLLLSADEWQKAKHSTSRLMIARRQSASAELLGQVPFEWLDATNFFGDEFSILQAIVPVEQYVALQETKKEKATEQPFKIIAETLSEIYPQKPVVRFVVAQLEAEQDQEIHVATPSPKITSESVDSALADAELLARSRGPASAVDRAHTALHGYLRAAVERAGDAAEPLASATQLFRQLRDRDERLRSFVEGSEHARRLVMALATIVDTANTLRNTASAAHPSGLLERAEAILVINATRSLIGYLDSKLDGTSL